MVGYNDTEDALTLADDESIEVGDYELEYSDEDDRWQAKYGRPIGGERGGHAELPANTTYIHDAPIGEHALDIDKEVFVRIPTAPYTFNAFACWFHVTEDVTSEEVDGEWEHYSGIHRGPITGRPDNGQTIWLGSFTGSSDGETISVYDGDDNTYIREDISVGWHHLVVSWNETEDRYDIYLDNTLPTIYTDTTEVEKLKSQTQLTARQNQELIPLKVDDVRGYSESLSSAEVDTLFNSGNVVDGLVVSYQFEYPETPRVAIDSTGDPFPLNSVPRAENNSLVPRGLAESVSEGKALADDGEMYDSVQTAVDNASGWVFVGPGTFDESVLITTPGLTIEGCGPDSVVTLNDTESFVIQSDVDDVTLRNIAVGGDNDGVVVDGENNTVDSIWAEQVKYGVQIRASNARVRNCTFTNSYRAVDSVDTGDGAIITGCTIENTDHRGISLDGADSVVSHNVIDGTGASAISMEGPDSICASNRTLNTETNGIYINDADIIVANNRTSSISDSGTGTLLDDNLTGESN